MIRFASLSPWYVLLMMLMMGAGLAGCTGIKRPTVDVISAHMGEQTDDAMLVRVGLRLRNPNREPLSLLEFAYRVEVDGHHAYTGRRSAQMTLSRLSTREVELPAVITMMPAATNDGASHGQPSTVRIRGSLRYLAPGAISQTLFDTGISKPSARFDGEHVLHAPVTSGSNAATVNDASMNPN